MNKYEHNSDHNHFGWALLGFFFPLVGLILFFVLKNIRPKTSKTVGISALIGAILFGIIYTISIIGVYLIGG